MTAVADTARQLTAVTLPVEGPLQLLDLTTDESILFDWGGRGLLGRGVALRVAPHEVEEALGAIEVRDEVGLPGCGPVALGALPFDPAAPGQLVVPRAILGRTPGGVAWLTTVGTSDSSEPIGDHDDGAGPRPPDAFTLNASRPHDQWCQAVRSAVNRIHAGELQKVVLARQVEVEANRPIRPSNVVRRLADLYPSCALFSIEGFAGASPELLVARNGQAVSSQPLAGTVPRSGDPAVDDRRSAELLASAKDRQEHQLVVDAVAAGLQDHCSQLDVPEEPSIVPLRNVSHLGTVISGRLADPSVSALDLALTLHPTPAVAGVPTSEALACIADLEEVDRGPYAGPVGWVDARGDGEWAVGIRSAQLSGNRARMMAGVGVVADSDPEEELVETQLKLQALLAAVVRP